MEWNDRERLSDLELDDLLREWKVANPPAYFNIATFPERRRYRVWLLPLVAACLLAAFAAGIFRHGAAPQTAAKAEGGSAALRRLFEPIPYTVPLGENESAAVVRMKIPVAALLAAGFRMPAADPAAVIAADVLVGADGRPHGIHLVSAITQNQEEK